jgi:CDP-glycerol glycerophosphotransferase (TagB/SpsB family)
MRGLEYAAAAAVLRVLAWLFARFPFHPSRIVLATARSSRLEGNLAYLHGEILGRDPDADVVTLLEPYGYGLVAKLAYFARTVRGTYYVWTSGLVILDNAYLPVHVARHRPATTVVQVWHAAAALKRFGLDGPLEREAERGFLHRHYDYVVVGGEAARAPYASALRTPMDRILAIGTPRTDFFFDREAMDAARRRLLDLHPQLRDRRVALYAPTFRGRGEGKRLSGFDGSRLRALLPPEWLLVLKAHPTVVPADGSEVGFDVVIDAATEVNEVFTVADVLVTDYSSAIFEWALLRRPLVLFVPDLDEYAANPGMYLDYRTEMIGTQVGDMEAAAAAIVRSAVDLAATEAFVARHLDACDGAASRRFVDSFLGDAAQRARLRADVHDHD